MADAVEVDIDIQGKGQQRWPGARLARLAANQHGVISRAQLAGLGASPGQIDRLIARRQLLPIHRGVYAVGHDRLTDRGRYLAAVLANKPGDVLSNLPAAANWSLIDTIPSLPPITTPSRRRQRKGMRLHFAPLPANEVTIRNGIPTTTVPRTILDVAATTGDFYLVERLMSEAEFHHRITPLAMDAALARHKGRQGTAIVREIHLARLPEKGVAKSWLERLFLRFLDRHDLPRPELNAPLALGGLRIKVDCLWRAQRLAVELDGRAGHIRAASFESDRARDRRLTVAGWQPMRVTRKHLEEDQAELARDLAALLRNPEAG